MENRNEKILSSLIEAAAEDALLQKMNDMPSCEDLDKIFEPSSKMDNKVQRLIKRAKKIEKAKKVLILTGKISSNFLVLFIITMTVLLSVFPRALNPCKISLKTQSDPFN